MIKDLLNGKAPNRGTKPRGTAYDAAVQAVISSVPFLVVLAQGLLLLKVTPLTWAQTSEER